jgi:hypothetical protein
MASHRSAATPPQTAIQDSADAEQAMPLEGDENAGQGEKAGQSEHTARAWLAIAGSYLVYFVSFGYMNSFGYFQDF